jgi:threonine/homoserine/homoserine lactone efflux protein
MGPVELWVLLAFVPAALALNLTPGPDMMFCLGQGLRGGAKAAVAAAGGVTAGSLVHTGLAGLGLGAAMAAHPGLFDVIRWAGVGYLLWLAYNTLRSGDAAQSEAKPLRPSAAFRDGFLVNLLNPKVILFILAFVPQFVDPSRGQVLAQFLTFGVVIGIGGMVVNTAVGLTAGGFGRRLVSSPRFARRLRYASAGIFTLLALRLAALQKA